MGLLDVLTGGKSSAAKRAAQAAIKTWQDINVPDISSQMIALQQLVSQGELSPEQAQTILQEQSAYSGISTDPRLQEAQMKALSQLQDVGSAGGMTAMDRAQLGDIMGQVQTSERGARDAILQNAQMRGIGGSGLELAAQLANNQAQAQNASQQGLGVASLAQQRALQAMMQSGQLAGNIQQQQFSQDAQKAAAQDAINRFNAANRQNVINQNVGARNAAAEQNLANRQNLANQNVGLQNQQQMYNKGLIQQRFQNEAQRAGGIAGGQQNLANVYQQQGGQVLGLLGGLASAGGTALGGYLGRKPGA